MFGESTEFDLSFLENLKGLIEDEHLRLEKELVLDSEFFNLSNCQCETEHYEYVQEKEVKQSFQKGFNSLGYELIIVGLYKQCELYLKKAVDLRFLSESKSKKRNLAELNTSLDEYHAINELRLINNCIKHQGKVSPSLSTDYGFWKVGDDLSNLDAVYDRLKTKVVSYIANHEQFLKCA
jgi:hypothetical protein